MPCEIELIRADRILTAVVRDRISRSELSRFVPAACGEVWSFIRSTGLPRPGRNVALYSDSDGTVEAGVEVFAPFSPAGRILCSQLPAGLIARTIHYGPYNKLFMAHTAIIARVAELGHRRAGVAWEIYGHWEESWNADASKIRTDVCHLLLGPPGSGA